MLRPIERGFSVVLVCLVLGCLHLSAKAADASTSWSADPALNQVVAGGAGVQGKPRLATTRDGGAYVAWFSSVDAPNYWQVKLNLIDQCGRKTWAKDLIVADNPQGSTFATGLIDYDLRVDSQGNALLVFTDFRGGSLNRNVFAYRISPAGQMLWTPAGVQLSGDNLTKSNPRIIETSDGTFAAMWVRLRSISPPVPAGLMFQRLDAAGNLLLDPAGVRVIGDETVNQTPNFFEMVRGDAGSVVVVYVRDTRTASSPRHVHAQSISPSGARLWNSGNPVVLYSLSNLPNTPLARPAVVSDENGGAIAAWYASPMGGSDTTICYGLVTRTGATPLDGGVSSNPAFVTVSNGSPSGISNSEPALVRFAPDSTSGAQRTAIVWRRTEVGGTQFSVQGAVMMDSTVVQQLALTGTSSTDRLGFSLQRLRDRLVLTWLRQELSGPGSQTVESLPLDVLIGGGLAPFGTPVLIASTPSIKNLAKHPLDGQPDSNILRDPPVVGLFPSGDILAGWCDRRTDSGDVLTQRFNVNPLSFGGPMCIADFNFDGVVSVQDVFDFLATWFAQGSQADADCSGLPPTVQDIFSFLSAWFNGC